MPNTPNFLVIMAEQHRADCLSCAGHSTVQTPNLDRLASEGTRFTRAYTSSPVCIPARGSLFTGLDCHSLGQWSNYGRLNPVFDNFPRRLRDMGRRTACIGNVGLYVNWSGKRISDDEPYMKSLGWTDVLETPPPGTVLTVESYVTDRWRELGCLESLEADLRRRRENGKGHYKSIWAGVLPAGEAYDDIVGRTAVEYLNRQERGKPFAAYVGFGAAHEPWDPPAEWLAKYDPQKMPPPKLQPSPEPPAWLPEKAAEHHRELHGPCPLSLAEIARLRAAYFAKISLLDHWVGRFLEALRERGLADDTMVVFCADHGEMLGDRGRIAKSVFYETATRIPLIVRAPGTAGVGRVCDRLTSLTDIFPTLVNAAGGDPTRAGFGRSLLPLLNDPQAPHHDAIFCEHRLRTMVRDERYKLAVGDDGETLKLFDLKEDPEELVNLVGKSGMEGIEAALRDRILRRLLKAQVRPDLRSRKK
jgi:choline-sulfatase